VGLEVALRDVRDRLAELARLLRAVRARADDRAPPRPDTHDGAPPGRGKPDHTLFGRVYDAELAVTGWVREARKAAAKARRAARSGPDLQAVRRALALCQGRFTAARRGLARELASRRTRADLRALAESRREWGDWATEVLAAVGPLPAAAKAAATALARCWRELAEYASAGVVIQNVAIGQQTSDTPVPPRPGRRGSRRTDP
jgi:hypothetical protein